MNKRRKLLTSQWISLRRIAERTKRTKELCHFVFQSRFWVCTRDLLTR